MSKNTIANGSAPADDTTVAEVAAQIVPEMDLGPLLKGAVRKAVEAKFATKAGEVAAGVVAAMLTPERLAGMQETAVLAAEAALDPAPEPEQTESPEQDGEQGQDEPAEPPREPEYPSTTAFVEGFVAQLYRREVSARGSERQLRWCPQWFAHGEVVSRFEGLHAAFESMRLGATTEWSAFWIVHCDPMMDRILDPEGPFKYCSASEGHRGKMPPLPCTEAPATREDGSYEDHHGIVVPPPAPRRRIVVPEYEPEWP